MIMGVLKTFSSVIALRNFLAQQRAENCIGFVPTMGALHEGHLSLVDRALESCELVVVSIFVNPAQFNDPADLETYPRDIVHDLELLSRFESVVVFHPTVEEVYPEDLQWVDLDPGSLGTVMEGSFRPGHFAGVMRVVKRLFDIVEPHQVFFGEKDFQQLAIIRFMCNELGLNVEIIACPTNREASGLARSSRNRRLSEREQEKATIIYRTLKAMRENVHGKTPEELIALAENMFVSSGLELEYIEIVDPHTLQPLTDWIPGSHACLAAHCGDVRLIDNIQIVPLFA